MFTPLEEGTRPFTPMQVGTQTPLPEDKDRIGRIKYLVLGMMSLLVLTTSLLAPHAPDEVMGDTSNLVASFPPEPLPMGFVVVDIRTDGILGERVRKLVAQLGNMFDLPIELWVGPATVELNNLDEQFGSDLMALVSDRLIVREMKKSHTYANITEDFTGVYGGHIGKGYALLESVFDIPVLLDTDVWPCTTDLIKKINRTIGNDSYDLLWTKSPHKNGATKNMNDVYVSPEISHQLKEFKNFRERNSGSVFAVNRLNRHVQDFLRDSLDIFVVQTNMDILGQPFYDQAAFRESLFLHRHDIRELILPDKYGCRKGYHGKCDCPCDCGNCILAHRKDFFDWCAAEYFPEL